MKWADLMRRERESDNASVRRTAIIRTAAWMIVGFVLGLLLVTLFSGCAAPWAPQDTQPVNIAGPKDSVASAGKAIATASDGIGTHATAALNGVNKSPDKDMQKTVVPELTKVQTLNAAIKAAAAELNGPTLAALEMASSNALALQKAKDEADAAAAMYKQKAEDEHNGWIHTLNTWLVILCIGSVLLAAAGVVVGLKVDAKTGVAMGVAAGAVLCPSLFVLLFERWLIIAGGIIVIGGLLALGVWLYGLWKQNDFKTQFADIGQYLKAQIAEVGGQTVLNKVRDTLSKVVPQLYIDEFKKVEASGNITTNAELVEKGTK